MKIRPIFIIGLSGSGKSTLANLLKLNLINLGLNPFVLDGDDMAKFGVLCADKGFDIETRLERAKSLANHVNWLINQDIFPVISVIGQPKEARTYWKKNINDYYEVYVKCDLDDCISRDFKGVYLNQENVIGKDIPFEEPKNPDIVLNSSDKSPDELIELLLSSIS